MSLTEREKEIVNKAALEVMRELDYPEDQFVTAHVAQAIVDKSLSRIREEQEAVGYIVPFEELGNGFDKRAGNVFWTNKPDSGPLFTTPPAAPCDCSELVEAINKVLSMQPYMATKVMEVCDILTEALANHAKRMKE